MWHIERACNWLVDHQFNDGGWGENFEACEIKEYVAADSSQVVNTAWALLGLMAVRLVTDEVSAIAPRLGSLLKIF